MYENSFSYILSPLLCQQTHTAALITTLPTMVHHLFVLWRRHTAFLPVFSLHSLFFFKFPLAHEALCANWWTQTIREPLAGQAPEKRHLWQLDVQLSFLHSEIFYIHITFCWGHFSSTVPSRWVGLHGNGHWGWMASAQAYVNWTISGVISYLTLGHGCLLFHPWFLKLKMLLSQGTALCFTLFFYLNISLFFTPPVNFIVVSQSCVKWRLMIHFVLQQSIKDWSLMAQREWRDQWRNDLKTFSIVSMASEIQPNADYVWKVQFCGQHLTAIKYW